MKIEIKCTALACRTARYLAVAQELNGQIYIYTGDKWVRAEPSKKTTTRERFRRACARPGARVIRGRIFIEVDQ